MGAVHRNVIVIDCGKSVIERVIEQVARVDIGPAAFAIKRMEFKQRETHSKNVHGVGEIFPQNLNRTDGLRSCTANGGDLAVSRRQTGVDNVRPAFIPETWSQRNNPGSKRSESSCRGY